MGENWKLGLEVGKAQARDNTRRIEKNCMVKRK